MVGIAWAEVGLSVAGSFLVAVMLWLFLPRGVVLTKVHPARVSDGEAIPDSWKLTNTSALPVRIVSAREIAPWHYMDGDFTLSVRERLVARFHGRAAQPGEAIGAAGGKGASLRYDDDHLETVRSDLEAPWAGQVVPPGESLTAWVGNIASLRIDYRRAGPFGILERRSTEIVGLG